MKGVFGKHKHGTRLPLLDDRYRIRPRAGGDQQGRRDADQRRTERE
jgi:hypothetical protein